MPAAASLDEDRQVPEDRDALRDAASSFAGHRARSVPEDGLVAETRVPQELVDDRMIRDGAITRHAGSGVGRRGPPAFLLGARPDPVPDQLVSRIADDDDLRAGNERPLRRGSFPLALRRGLVRLRGDLGSAGASRSAEKDFPVLRAIRPRTQARHAVGNEAGPGAVGGTSELEFRRRRDIANVAELVAATAGETENVVATIRPSRGGIVDRVSLGIDGPVRIRVGVWQDDVVAAVLHSTFKSTLNRAVNFNLNLTS